MPRNNRVGAMIRQARENAGLSLRALARLAGTSHATLLAYESGKKVPAATTLFRILEACGNAVDVHLEPRIREQDDIPRGEELAAVLKLASQFPVRATRYLELPRFPHG